MDNLSFFSFCAFGGTKLHADRCACWTVTDRARCHCPRTLLAEAKTNKGKICQSDDIESATAANGESEKDNKEDKRAKGRGSPGPR